MMYMVKIKEKELNAIQQDLKKAKEILEPLYNDMNKIQHISSNKYVPLFNIVNKNIKRIEKMKETNKKRNEIKIRSLYEKT